jgi:hypothetical protein
VAPANITINATAEDADGAIARVEFYAGTQLIGTATASPFSITWADVAAGSYSLTAVARDDEGASTTSGAISVVVNSPPGPGTGVAFVQQAGRDAGTATSASLAFPAPNTSGNLIAVVVRASSLDQVFTVTDTRGNQYRKAIQFNVTADGVSLAMFYAENVGGGTNTVTVRDTQSGTLRFSILEYSGIAPGTALDVCRGKRNPGRQRDRDDNERRCSGAGRVRGCESRQCHGWQRLYASFHGSCKSQCEACGRRHAAAQGRAGFGDRKSVGRRSLGIGRRCIQTCRLGTATRTAGSAHVTESCGRSDEHRERGRTVVECIRRVDI